MPTMQPHTFTTRTRRAEAEEKYHYQIMAPSKRKTRDQPTKKRIFHSDIRSRVKSVRRKRANTPYRQQSHKSISIPQLVYELLTIDKYNQGNTIEI